MRPAMNDEQMKMKASRESYWSEISPEERLERTRKAVKRLQREVALLNKYIRYLQTHKHLPDGEIVVPMFMQDEPQLTRMDFPQTGDDVYF